MQVRLQSDLGSVLDKVRKELAGYTIRRAGEIADRLHDRSPVQSGLYRANHSLGRRNNGNVYGKNRNSRIAMRAQIKRLVKAGKPTGRLVFFNNVRYARSVERRHNVYQRSAR